MLETEKGKRMDQVLASGATREELAEALWCAEYEKRLWKECVDALREENAKLRTLSTWAIICSEGDVLCEGCPYHTTEDGRIVCTIRTAAAELGVEVPE